MHRFSSNLCDKEPSLHRTSPIHSPAHISSPQQHTLGAGPVCCSESRPTGRLPAPSFISYEFTLLSCKKVRLLILEITDPSRIRSDLLYSDPFPTISISKAKKFAYASNSSAGTHQPHFDFTLDHSKFAFAKFKEVSEGHRSQTGNFFCRFAEDVRSFFCLKQPTATVETPDRR